jgi:hypothetical protein
VSPAYTRRGVASGGTSQMAQRSSMTSKPTVCLMQRRIWREVSRNGVQHRTVNRYQWQPDRCGFFSAPPCNLESARSKPASWYSKGLPGSSWGLRGAASTASLTGLLKFLTTTTVRLLPRVTRSFNPHTSKGTSTHRVDVTVCAEIRGVSCHKQPRMTPWRQHTRRCQASCSSFSRHESTVFQVQQT